MHHSKRHHKPARPCRKVPLTVSALLLAVSLATFPGTLRAGPVDELTDAARLGQLDEVRRALEAGVDPDAEDAEKLPAIIYAAANGHLKILKLLLDKGADPNRASSESGSTALHLAAQFNQPESAKTLLVSGADINGQDQLGMTPLIKATYACRVGMVALLLKKGADPSLKDGQGETALDAARRRLDRYHTLMPGEDNDSGGIKTKYRRIIGLLEKGK